MEPSLKKQRIVTQTSKSRLDECYKLFKGTAPVPKWSKEDLADFKKWYDNLEACFETEEQLRSAILVVLYTVFRIVGTHLGWPLYNINLAPLVADDPDLNSLGILFGAENEDELGTILRLTFHLEDSSATLFFGCGCEEEIHENRFWPEFYMEMHTLSESRLKLKESKRPVNPATKKLVLFIGCGIGAVVDHLFSGMSDKVISFCFCRWAPFPNTANIHLIDQRNWEEEED